MYDCRTEAKLHSNFRTAFYKTVDTILEIITVKNFFLKFK